MLFISDKQNHLPKSFVNKHGGERINSAGGLASVQGGGEGSITPFGTHPKHIHAHRATHRQTATRVLLLRKQFLCVSSAYQVCGKLQHLLETHCPLPGSAEPICPSRQYLWTALLPDRWHYGEGSWDKLLVTPHIRTSRCVLLCS